MASFYRLIAAFLLLFSGASFAAFPPVPLYSSPSHSSGQTLGPAPASAICAMQISGMNAASAGSSYTYSASPKDPPGACDLLRSDGAGIFVGYYGGTPGCPPDSALVNGQCVCSSSHVQDGSQCKPKKSDVCGSLEGMGLGLSSMDSDFGRQSSGWAGSKVGTSANACMGGCQVSGAVTSCVVGMGASSTTVCSLASPSFTGGSCDSSVPAGGGDDGTGGDPKPSVCPPGYAPSKYAKDVCVPIEEDKSCPAGYEPSKFVHGVCIPKPNDCAAGSSPSKYAEGVCIPDEAGDDGSCEDPKDPSKRAECEGSSNKCPTGQVPSTKLANTCVSGKDGVGTDKDGNKVECKDGTCTTTKPDGTKEGKDQETTCKEKPDLAVCKEEPKSKFSGSCGSYSCEGDAISCALTKEVHRANCQWDDLKNTDLFRLGQSESSLVGIDITKNLPGNKNINILLKDNDEFLRGTPVGLTDKVIELPYLGVLVLPFSLLNPTLIILGNVFVIICSIAGAFIIVARR